MVHLTYIELFVLAKQIWRVFYVSARLNGEIIKHKNKPFLTVTNELCCPCDGGR